MSTVFYLIELTISTGKLLPTRQQKTLQAVSLPPKTQHTFYGGFFFFSFFFSFFCWFFFGFHVLPGGL